MKAQAELIDELANMIAEGKTITLLCSSACEDRRTAIGLCSKGSSNPDWRLPR